MKFTAPWLTIFLLTVASAEDLSSISRKEPEDTQKNDEEVLISEVSRDKISLPNTGRNSKLRIEKLKQNDDNDLALNSDVTMGDLLFFESLVNSDKVLAEGSQRNPDTSIDSSEESSEIDSNSKTPLQSKTSHDLIDTRRQGELKPEVKIGKSVQDIQFDDSKVEAIDSPLRFGQRKSKQKEQDDAPVLQLTQGGYNRPFRRPRFRQRYFLRRDNSDPSSRVEEPTRNSNDNKRPETKQIIPQVTYSSPPEQPQAFGTRPAFNSGSEEPRNMIAIHHVVPTPLQNTYFNNPPFDISNFPFQAQFSQSNELGGFPNFGRDSNNAAFFQTPRRNPFQIAPGVLYQNAPDVQTQPILMEPSSARNVPPQYQLNTFNPYPGFENAVDSRPNYATYFRNPNVNGQFQVPPNFYTTAPDGVRAFNSPTSSFLTNYPNSENFPSRLFRYPVKTNAQNNQQNSKENEPVSDASREGISAKIEDRESVKEENDDNLSVASIGTRLQAQNEADVYMRYPTIEAGYAIEENLPSQNNSEVKDNSQGTNSEQRNFLGADPFRNVLNSARVNQRINNSFGFPPELFRDVPIDFGYQNPGSQILIQYPDTNRKILRYPSPTFEPRGTFDPLASLPENNYKFLTVDSQKRSYPSELNEVPSCAEQNNTSVCFIDSEYPSKDILYSLKSNTFLADRLFGQETPLDSVAFVERNATDSDQTSENYACSVDTQYGSPLRAKNIEGVWRVIVNVQGKFSQPVRMEVCKSLGDPCSYVESKTKTSCVQKFSLQRLMSWSPSRGIYSDVYKIPVACSCQILKADE